MRISDWSADVCSSDLASNSLLEGVVFGRRLGAWLAESRIATTATGTVQTLALGPSLDNANGQCLRELMWQHLGPMRSTTGLDRALPTIATDPVLHERWAGQLARPFLTAARPRHPNTCAPYRAHSKRRDYEGGKERK